MSVHDEHFTPLVIRVKKWGYIPKECKLRVRISGMMITADCESKEDFEAIKKDPQVETAYYSRILAAFEPPSRRKPL